MKTTLVGYTGFVGGNLAVSHRFDSLYNSKNIEQAFGAEHELVVYAGVRAEKFLANKAPERDKALVREALLNIRRMKPKKLVLISTMDVYKDPREVDETTPIDSEGLHPYGFNRYLLEQWVQEEVPDCHIIRLPGLFGAGLKKNFIHDMMTLVPSMLREDKYIALSAKEPFVAHCYAPADSGFYRLVAKGDELARLRRFFEKNDFNSLSFTDSRSVYQFYDLKNLWTDINRAIENDIRLLNISSEPMRAAEVFNYVTGKTFKNEILDTPLHYDWRSVHAEAFGGKDGYIYQKSDILEAIRRGVLSGTLLKKPGE